MVTEKKSEAKSADTAGDARDDNRQANRDLLDERYQRQVALTEEANDRDDAGSGKVFRDGGVI